MPKERHSLSEDVNHHEMYPQVQWQVPPWRPGLAHVDQLEDRRHLLQASLRLQLCGHHGEQTFRILYDEVSAHGATSDPICAKNVNTTYGSISPGRGIWSKCGILFDQTV